MKKYCFVAGYASNLFFGFLRISFSWNELFGGYVYIEKKYIYLFFCKLHLFGCRIFATDILYSLFEWFHHHAIHFSWMSRLQVLMVNPPHIRYLFKLRSKSWRISAVQSFVKFPQLKNNNNKMQALISVPYT